MSHSLAPGWVNLFYNSNGHDHKQTIPVAVSGTPTPGTNMMLDPSVGSPISDATFVAALVAVLKPFFAAASHFDRFESWYKATADSDPIFIFGDAIDEDGTAAGAALPAGEGVLSWRCGDGSLLRMYLMEPAVTQDEKLSIPAQSTGPVHNLDVYVRGNSSPIISRKNGDPIVGINWTTKRNDKLRKKYLLTA